MGKPVSERIADVLFKRLQQLEAGFSANTPVSEVVRLDAKRGSSEYQPKHNQIILEMAGKEVNEDYSHHGNPPALAWDITFRAAFLIMPSDADSTSFDTYREFAIADIHKVIAQNPSNWYRMENLAIDTRFQSPENIDSGNYRGIAVPILVTYRTDEDDPYEVRA